jgi:mono/diheme cytochrome c family protein
VRRALAAAVVLAASTVHAYTPEVDYVLNCQGCHRADGAGTPGSVPPLKDTVARFLGVTGGREYLGRVPGVAQAPLDDAALAAVLNWMLDHFDHAHVPPAFTPYAADEVGRLRRDPLVDVEGTRRKLLAAMDGGH